MRNSSWKIAAVTGVAALIIAAIVIVLVASNRDRAPGGSLPDVIAPSADVTARPSGASTETAPASTPEAVPDKVTLIGDSIMVAAENALYEYIPGCVVNAKEGRQLVEAMDILYDMEEAVPDTKSVSNTMLPFWNR